MKQLLEVGVGSWAGISVRLMGTAHAASIGRSRSTIFAWCARSTLRAPLLLAATILLLAGCQSFPTTLKQVEKAAPAAVELDIRQWRTQAGTQVLFVPSPTIPMLDIQLTFAAGSSRDGDNLGLASMTSSLIDEGARSEERRVGKSVDLGGRRIIKKKKEDES